MTTSANPNGKIAIVFTYVGSAFKSYADFLKKFYVTLPGGGGVTLGSDQYFGFANGTSNVLVLGTSYRLSKAASPISGLLPTNADSANLQAAFTKWASSQAASPGQTSYANLYLDHYTGGRIYLSNGALGLGPSGEPVPASTTDHAYDLAYDLIEPFIGAQVGSTTIPGNGADITDIDWFSFPITVKVWYYDFSNPSSKSLTNDVPHTTTIENGGNGQNIYNVLKVGSVDTSGTNEYPNKARPVPNTDPTKQTPMRLAGPTAAAASDYYTDPADNLYPYHYFDDYFVFLAGQQGNNSSSFTLTGSYAGSGKPPQPTNLQAQQFSFEIDFSNITTQPTTYPNGSVVQITAGSSVKFKGYTFNTDGDTTNYVLGSPSEPFTIELPWAKGSTTYILQVSSTKDALVQGWLSQASTQTAQSGTYSPIAVTAADGKGNTIPALNQTVTNLQLVYSVNPVPTQPEDLWQGGNGKEVTVSNESGLTLTKNASYTQAGDDTTAVIIIGADAGGNLASIKINDAGGPSNTGKGSTWTIAKGATGLGNNQSFTVTLTSDPSLRNAFILASANWQQVPSSLQGSFTTKSGATATVTLQVEPAGMAAPTWAPDSKWTTLDQPAGIYGANTGYTISGLTGANESLNGDYNSLQNDVFGWVVADLLAALNVGFVGAPALVPGTNKTIGDSPQIWFDTTNNLYSQGLWGAKAWKGASPPVSDFWNTWAYELFNVPGGTDAYGFAFTDRFAASILVGFNPPSTSPSGLTPVLLEIIVDDSPLLPS